MLHCSCKCLHISRLEQLSGLPQGERKSDEAYQLRLRLVSRAQQTCNICEITALAPPLGQVIPSSSSGYLQSLASLAKPDAAEKHRGAVYALPPFG